MLYIIIYNFYYFIDIILYYTYTMILTYYLHYLRLFQGTVSTSLGRYKPVFNAAQEAELVALQPWGDRHLSEIQHLPGVIAAACKPQATTSWCRFLWAVQDGVLRRMRQLDSRPSWTTHHKLPGGGLVSCRVLSRWESGATNQRVQGDRNLQSLTRLTMSQIAR